MPQKRLISAMQAAEIANRIAKGATRRQLAKEYGVSPMTISRCLTREETPSEMRNKKLKPCGTNAAYARHLRNKEIPCDACTRAHAQNKLEWTKRDKLARIADEKRRDQWLKRRNEMFATSVVTRLE